MHLKRQRRGFQLFTDKRAPVHDEAHNAPPSHMKAPSLIEDLVELYGEMIGTCWISQDAWTLVGRRRCSLRKLAATRLNRFVERPNAHAQQGCGDRVARPVETNLRQSRRFIEDGVLDSRAEPTVLEIGAFQQHHDQFGIVAINIVEILHRRRVRRSYVFRPMRDDNVHALREIAHDAAPQRMSPFDPASSRHARQSRA